MQGLLDVTQGSHRLLDTTKGYLGIAPAAAEVGDRVCIFLGGRVLYVIISRENGHYEFTGECYVHGVMDGEAVKNCDSGRTKE
ncbi:uncharacterized protein K441DRAFT_592399 [Cenococcum geophilum 1.58]|uniref:Uncharacterized protein n=1 Tax=Cenococcum geophilum 1.58 TaxID=794803 RepID=A0ACC8ENK0_9PEZI|nr:hypothetical protein K441DRAFT_592399 [Cenococcum geophilum 1.58]